MTSFINNDSAQRIRGTNGFDTFLIEPGSAGDGADRFEGRGGADFIYGGLSSDTLIGGLGDDELTGGVGDDLLDGGGGSDTVDYRDAKTGVEVDLQAGTADVGAEGVDTLISLESIRASSFADTLYGTRGDNNFLGGGGDDLMFGRGGTDQFFISGGRCTVDGGGGDDQVSGTSVGSLEFFGRAGDDYVLAGDGRDTLNGEGGDDYLRVDTIDLSTAEAADRCDGGGGNDTIDSQGGADTLIGGAGQDTVNIRVAGRDLRLDLADGVLAVGNGVRMQVSGFESASLGGGDATLIGLNSANDLGTSEGDDTIRGLSGADSLSSYAGDDRVDGGAGDDFLFGGDGSDVLVGGAGADAFAFRGYSDITAAGVDTIAGFESGLDLLDFQRFFVPGPIGTRSPDFVLIGKSKFSGALDEIRFANGLLSVNLDEDLQAEYLIRIEGVDKLSRSDFVFDL